MSIDHSLTEEERNSIISHTIDSIFSEFFRITKEKINGAYRNFTIKKQRND